MKKKRQGSGVINKLKKKNGNVVHDDSDILAEITNFYDELYKSKSIDEIRLKQYMKKCKTKKLSEDEKQTCERDITIEEVYQAIDNLKQNKSPGLDGLTPEFYQTFKSEIIKPLYNMMLETYAYGVLPDSARKAVVTLIYKKGCDMELSNYGPISLTNYDYKTIAFVLSRRLQLVMSNLIDESQTAYIKQRYLGTNVRLIQDIIEYCNSTNRPGIVVGLDFQKAFDTLEWPFIVQTLRKFWR